jgi:hypothetical protein
MTRIDYENCPEWLAFAARAHELRRDEIARIARAFAEWIAGAIDQVVAPASTPISRDTRIGMPGR